MHASSATVQYITEHRDAPSNYLSQASRTMQMIVGGGGVAIAFAVDLCQGIDTSQVTYNKTGMRAHLSCFEDGKMKQFPSVKKHGRQPKVMKLQLS